MHVALILSSAFLLSITEMRMGTCLQALLHPPCEVPIIKPLMHTGKASSYLYGKRRAPTRLWQAEHKAPHVRRHNAAMGVTGFHAYHASVRREALTAQTFGVYRTADLAANLTLFAFQVEPNFTCSKVPLCALGTMTTRGRL